MSYQVIYCSRNGSTQKIADAIASELGIHAEDVKTATLRNDSFLFLGSGCYGGKPGKQMTTFIENNDFTNRNVALFGTSGGGEGAEVRYMENLLQGNNVHAVGTFFCKGKFWFGNKNRPSETDLEHAKQFARTNLFL
jgi:flavodoxin I